MGLFMAVAARMELQEVTASAGRECGLYPKLYVLHMLDGNAASARAVQAVPQLEWNRRQQRRESATSFSLSCLYLEQALHSEPRLTGTAKGLQH